MLDKWLKDSNEFVAERTKAVTKENEEQQRNKELRERKEKEQAELLELNKNTFSLLKEHLQHAHAKRLAPNETVETIVLNNGFIDFDDLGYAHNTLVVGDIDNETTLTVEYKGVNYSITLQAGQNFLNLLHGSRISSPSKTIVCALVRHTHKQN